ncbi:MAG: hypothetical protein ACRCTZ_01950 [Sarcina sp.]
MNSTEPLTIRLRKSQKKYLEDEAVKNGFNSVNSYILSILFPEETKNSNRTASTSLTHQEILDRLKKYPSGTKISIPELFSSKEWINFDNTVSIGRTFRIAAKNPSSAVSQVVDFFEKRSGYPAVYIIK